MYSCLEVPHPNSPGVISEYMKHRLGTCLKTFCVHKFRVNNSLFHKCHEALEITSSNYRQLSLREVKQIAQMYTATWLPNQA